MNKILLTGLLLISPACKKQETGAVHATPATELLTQKPWMLTSLGFDDNGNNKIDPPEESIEDCQKDNKWYYYRDGTGLFDENILSCGTGPEKLSFTWKFIDNEKAIDFFHDSLKLLLLTEQEMILYKELVFADGGSLKIMMHYKH